MAIKEVERKVTTLVPFYLPADSANLRALLECDSLNNVILKDLAEQKSKHVRSQFSYQNGALNYNIKTERDTVYVRSDTVFLQQDVPVSVEVVKYRMSKTQHIFYLIGIIATTLACVGIILKIKRITTII